MSGVTSSTCFCPEWESRYGFVRRQNSFADFLLRDLWHEQDLNTQSMQSRLREIVLV